MSTHPQRVILVTGANRGIGFAIIQALASQTETADSTFLLGCRDSKIGKEAIEQLDRLEIKAAIQEVVIDVTSDKSIFAALDTIQNQYGRLDVLINNAGYAAIPSSSDTSSWREIYAQVFDTNITSVAMVTQAFLPLLRDSPFGRGKVIQISSARGSITRSSEGLLPPTVSIPYVLSKTALNMLTVEMSRDEKNRDVEFAVVSPGHCRTAFNGFRGTRDPLEGANVVVELVRSEKGKYKNAGFWETQGSDLALVEVLW